ncbi:hypothetical protein NC651_039315 [Populus alba x Populus x berolinensis]|nr:hypothetical protein NC651_039315 [Populus alba x Populus x berolinensis]
MATSLVSAPAAHPIRLYLFPIANSGCVFFSALGARTSRGAVITSCNSSATLSINRQEQHSSLILPPKSVNSSSNMTAGYPFGPPSSVSTNTRGTRRQGEGEDTRRPGTACVSNSRMQPATVPNRVTDLDQ